jgi:hypothetical protein
VSAKQKTTNDHAEHVRVEKIVKVPGPLMEGVKARLTSGQAEALRALGRALGDKDEARVAGNVLSVGLFVLGMDPAGDYRLDEITEALFAGITCQGDQGESDAPSKIFNFIVDAAGEAETLYTARVRRERVLELEKAEEVGA